MADTKRKTVLDFVAENNTKTALNEIKQDVRSVGDATAQAGQKAGAAFDSMGKASADAGAKLDRATQGAMRSMERYVASLQSGGKKNSEYFESMARARGADMQALGPYIQQMKLAEQQTANTARVAQQSAKSTAARVEEMRREQQQLGVTARAVDDYAKAYSSLQRVVGLAMGATAVWKTIDAVDGWGQVASQIRMATKSQEEYNLVMQRTARSAKETYRDVGEVRELFVRTGSSIQDLGYSLNQALDLTESFSFLLVTNSASADKAASAINAYSKAIQTGRLGAEEWKAVTAAMPTVIDQLVQVTGKSAQEIKTLGLEGKVSISDLNQTLITFLDTNRQASAEMPTTVREALGSLSSSVRELLGYQNQVTGVTAAMVDGLNLLSKNLDVVAYAAGALALVMASRVAVSVGLATTSLISQQAAAVRLSVAIAGTGAAWAGASTAMAAASRGLAASLAFLTGPWGAALLLAGGVAAAFYAFRDSTTELQKTIGDLNQPLDQLKEKLDKLPREVRIGIKVEIEREAAQKARAAQAEYEALGTAVLGTLMNFGAGQEVIQQFYAQLEEAKAVGKDLTPVLEAAAKAANLSDSVPEAWTELARRFREAQQAAGGFAAAAKAAGDAAEPKEGAAPADAGKAALANAQAVIKESSAYRSLAQQMDAVREKGRVAQVALDALVAAKEGNSKEAKELRGVLAGVNEQLERMGKRGQGAAVAQDNAYKTLIASITAKVAANKEELETGGKLSDSDKMRFQLQAQLDAGTKKLSVSQRAAARALLDTLEVQERELNQRKLAIKLYEEQQEIAKELADEEVKRSKALESARKAMDAYETSAREDFERLQLEASLIGASNQVRTIALAQYEAELELRRKIAEIDAMDATPEQREELRSRARAVAVTRIAIAERKAYVSEWEKTSQTIGRTLSDYIMGGGKDAAQYLKRLFATLVLEPVVNYGVQGMMSGLGMGPGQQAGGGMGNLISLGRSAYSAFNSPMFSNFGMGLGLNINGIGTKMFEMGMESAGESLMDFGVSVAEYADAINLAGDVLGYGKALYSLSQGKYGSAIGTGVGQWFGGPIGAAIGSMLGGVLDNAFGSRGANHSGAAASSAGIGNDAAALQIFGRASGAWYGDVTKRHSSAMETQLAGTVGALSDVYKQLAGYAGETARQIDVIGAFAVNGKYGDEDAYGYGQIRDSLTGEVLAAFTNRNLGTDANAAWDAYVGQMGGLIVDQLKAADIPGWMRGEFDKLGDTITVDGLNQALQAIAAVDASFKSWANTLAGFADLSGDVQTALLQVSGGLEGLAGNVGAFYQSFYDEAERMDILQRQVREALAGLEVGLDPSLGNEAKEGFKWAVENALAAGNGELAAQLLAMGQSFATAADYAQKTADEAIKAAQESAERVSEIMGQQNELWAMLAEAQGDHARAAQLRYELETAGMNEAERAAYDYIASIRAQVSAAQAASASLKSLSDQQWQLENQLLTLQGNTGAVASRTREKELGELLEGVTDEDQRRRITASYDYNRSLQQQIEAMQAAQQAASAAASAQQQAADRIRSSWQQIGDSVVNEINRIRGLVVGDSGMGLDYYQAQFAIASAQARAGDQDAAQKLTEISQQMLGVAQSGALSMYELQRLRAVTASSLEDTLEELQKKFGISVNVPQFAGGGMHDGGLRIVGERGWELEATGPARIWNQQQIGQALGGGGNAELVAEIRGMREHIARLESQLASISRNTSGVPQLVEQFDQVTEGGNAMRADVVNDSVKVDVANNILKVEVV